MPREIKAELNGAGRRIAIAVGRFNDLVTDRLLRGALDTLTRHGVDDEAITVVRVPGSFELGQACRWLAGSGDYDAVLALGVVIRGATSHYDYVCAQAARGVLDAAVATDVPVAFGVLTCETMEQALDRAGGKAGNKGTDAALTALEMASLRRSIHA